MFLTLLGLDLLEVQQYTQVFHTLVLRVCNTQRFEFRKKQNHTSMAINPSSSVHYTLIRPHGLIYVLPRYVNTFSLQPCRDTGRLRSFRNNSTLPSSKRFGTYSQNRQTGDPKSEIQLYTDPTVDLLRS